MCIVRFLFIVLSSLSLLGIMPSRVHTEVSANLLTNGDFERSDSELTGWSTYCPRGAATFAIDSTKSHGGRNSLKIQTPSDIKALLVGEPIPVSPGEKISLSVWVYGDEFKSDSGGRLLFNAAFLNSRKGYFQWHRAMPELKTMNEWVHLETETVVPENAAYVSFQVGVELAMARTWWDDAVLTTDTPVAIRFDLESTKCEPGKHDLPAVLINRSPGLSGKSVTLAAEPGGWSGEATISDQLLTAVHARFDLQSRGPALLTLTVAAAGETPFSTTATVQVPALMETEPLVPTHWCIEDGTPRLEGRIWVHEKPDVRDTLSLGCTLKDGEKELAGWFMAKLPHNPILFHIDAPDLGLGDYEVEIVLRSGRSVVAQAKKDWHVIHRSECEVRIGGDGFLVVQGEPFFPIGIFNGSRFAEQAEAGFNVAHGYNAMKTTPGEVYDNSRAKAFLDEAMANGLKTLMLVTHGNHHRDVNEEFIRRIKMFRNHPGLLAWDEEEGVARGEMPLSNLERMFEIIRRESPHRLFMVGDARDAIFQVEDRSELFPEKYMDMGMWWWYPFAQMPNTDGNALEGEEHSSSPELALPTFLTEAKTKKPIWVGVQCYKKPREGARYPTREEYRVQGYLSVIAGAKGLMYYGGSVTGGIHLKGAQENWEELKTVARELRDMAPVFLAPDAREEIALSPADAPIEFRAKETAEGMVVLAANRSQEPVDATFGFSSHADGPVEVRFEDRVLNLKDGALKDRFEPLGVHVYVLRRIL